MLTSPTRTKPANVPFSGTSMPRRLSSGSTDRAAAGDRQDHARIRRCGATSRRSPTPTSGTSTAAPTARAVAIGLFCGLIPGSAAGAGARRGCLVRCAPTCRSPSITTFYTNPLTIVPLYVVAYEYGRAVLPGRAAARAGVVAAATRPASPTGLPALVALDGAARQAAGRRARPARRRRSPASAGPPCASAGAATSCAAWRRRARLRRAAPDTVRTLAMKPPYWDAGDRRRSPRRDRGARGLVAALSGHPPHAPRRPVHHARPRDRRPADLGQGRAVDLGSLRRARSRRARGDPRPRSMPARVGRTRMPTLRRVRAVGAQGASTCATSRATSSGALDPREWTALDDEALIARAGRRQGHRPLDRRDVPHLPRAAPRRAAGRRHRPAEGDRAALPRRRAHAAPAELREFGARWAP